MEISPDDSIQLWEAGNKIMNIIIDENMSNTVQQALIKGVICMFSALQENPKEYLEDLFGQVLSPTGKIFIEAMSDKYKKMGIKG